MAEGFLQHAQEMKQMKRWGHRYFHDLLWRSFFQQSTGNKSRYVMHDLVNDLAKSVSGEICLHLEDDGLKGIKSHANVRHSAFTCHRYDRYQRFEGFYEMSNLRTFLALSTHQWEHNFLYIRVVHDIVPKLKRLRVLSVAQYRFEELSSSIGALKHLRYLDLSYNTGIIRLPNSLSNLQNLQTLKLCGCRNLIELPTGIGALIKLMHLDLKGTEALQEMPLGVANLINLQTLSKFMVGKGSNCLGIRELMNLPHLEGQLRIEELQNVARNEGTNLVDLKKIENLGDLALVWTDKLRDSPCEEDHEFQVLNMLEPHQKLERLLVRFYGGKKFPLWIGDPAFTNMVDLELSNCRNITLLPPLGGLPKLEKLSIKGMDELLEVRLELSPSLEILEIEDMLKLKQWAHSDDVNVEVTRKFPRLSEITIFNCPKLVVTLPTSLPSLEELDICGCQDIILESVHDLCSLQNLSIRRISALENLHQVVTQSLVALENLSVVNCSQLIHLWQGSTNLDKLSCLKSLRIVGCQRLVSLVGGEEGNLPCNLEILKIWECDGLENLPNGLQTLTSLRGLSIHWCPKLVSFPSAGLPCSLKSLEIVYCPSLKSLPQGILHDSNARNEISHLEVVSVGGCPSLTSLPIGEFPYSIKNIDICFWTTRLLDSFHNRFSNLTKLAIYDSELESFPESGLAIPNLSRLTIRNCGNLRLLPNQIQNLTSLHDLEIHSCGDLVSFPDEGLPPNLTSLSILRCENLRSLPNQMQNLTSLQRLQMCNCGGLVSFPDGGLPPKLGRLTISNCKNLKQPISEWRLKTLASLTCLTIAGPCPSTDMDSFPDEKGPLLPSSLTSLQIGDFKNLKSISRGIHHLTSLDALVIRNCPKLQSFPKEGLPSTLESLAIFECPLLERRCRKEKGDYWRFIANIPSFIQKSPEIQ
ncbi:putative disease resistance protein At3g14460 [Jatropha curcas]|uniref:putative disease resistance protein At3g14460 n=1 Tax=Jatropha curcas TaxID=180498 RepID=UPI00189540A0|nr:putative disease resistance protein At3g14460 [Jatropha curcas]